MAEKSELNRLEPLEADQLWSAHLLVDDGSVVVERRGAETLQLQRLTESMMETSFGRKYEDEKLRWLFQSVVGKGVFESDLHYNPFIVRIMGEATKLDAHNEPTASRLVQQAGNELIVRRNKRYPVNIRHLGACIRQHGDIYVAYGPSRSSVMQVARLERVVGSPAASDGRRYPVAILSGRDGRRGLKPVGINQRKELLVSSR